MFKMNTDKKNTPKFQTHIFPAWQIFDKKSLLHILFFEFWSKKIYLCFAAPSETTNVKNFQFSINFN